MAGLASGPPGINVIFRCTETTQRIRDRRGRREEIKKIVYEIKIRKRSLRDGEQVKRTRNDKEV
jgi:hypothetical protein